MINIADMANCMHTQMISLFLTNHQCFLQCKTKILISSTYTILRQNKKHEKIVLCLHIAKTNLHNGFSFA